MRRGAGIAGNPVLIGAATILVVLVAVFLAYNANSGLPFVPTYELKAEVPSAANLVVGNDVRIGGSRVGSVSAIEPAKRDDGTSIAVLTLTLEKDVAPLPRDSTLLIRPRSALGLKYVELTRGTDARGYADGATMPITAATPRPVEFDEVLSMFDDKTRVAVAENTNGFGDAFAGRGESLNTAIGAFRPLLRNIVPVAKNLSSPDTHLRRLFDALGRTAAIVAPAAEDQAQLFVNLDTTFRALREVSPFIRESIVEGVPALDAGIRDFPIQRPFLRNSTALFHELQPGSAALRRYAGTIADAEAEGAKVLPRTPPLNRRLASLLKELQRFAEDPMVPRGLRATTTALNTLQPTLAFLTPAQTQCNYVTLFFRNVASHLSEGDRNGTWQRFIIVPTPQGPNNEGSPSSGPADGPDQANHLHANPYPNTASPGQPRECEAGNEPYQVGKTVIGNPAGTQSATTEKTSK
jgi:phospholipid/cholesterol/gamma-HCH transport system substrate-binding protein